MSNVEGKQKELPGFQIGTIFATRSSGVVDALNMEHLLFSDHRPNSIMPWRPHHLTSDEASFREPRRTKDVDLAPDPLLHMQSVIDTYMALISRTL